MEVRYGTLNEVVTPFGEMTKDDLENMAKLGYGVKVAALTQVDERSWNAISVEAAEVAGEITGASVQDWTDQKQWWDDYFPVNIPFGHDVYVRVSFKNTGNVDVNFRVTIQVIDPDGIVATERVYVPAPPPFVPGEGSTCMCDKLTIDKAGTWVIHATLEAELA